MSSTIKFLRVCCQVFCVVWVGGKSILTNLLLSLGDWKQSLVDRAHAACGAYLSTPTFSLQVNRVRRRNVYYSQFCSTLSCALSDAAQ